MEERGGIGGGVVLQNSKEFPTGHKGIGYPGNFKPFLQLHASTLWNEIMFMRNRFSCLLDLESCLLSLLNGGELFLHLMNEFIHLSC